MTVDDSLDTLLEHADWVRGLAESLLLDQVDVDDVVQQTWLAAIERAPRPVTAPRGWLAAVVRNVALQMSRSEGRRRRALPSVALGDGAGIEDRTAEHLDVHRRLVATVESLEDVDRSLIVMRYFEGRKPKEMARELELPVTTVRNRLSRALERLRARLDRESGGRRAWSLALVGFLSASIAGVARAAVPGGAAAPSFTSRVARRITAGRLAAAALIVGAVITVHGLVSTDPATEGLDHLAADRGEVAQPVARSRDPVPAARATAGVAATVAAGAAEPAPPEPVFVPPRLRGRVRDDHGAPVVGASVRVIDDAKDASVAYDEISKFERRTRGADPEATAVTDAAGAFDVVTGREGRFRVVVRAAGHSLGVEHTGRLGGGDCADLVFTLSEVPSIACIVVDEDSRPLEGVEVTIHTPEGWVADHSRQLVERRVTGDDGAFEFDLQQIQLTDVREFVWDNITAGRVASQQAITLAKRGRVTRTIDRFGGLRVDREGRLMLTMKRARDVELTFVPPPGERIDEPIDFLVKMFTSRIIRRGRTDAKGHAVVRDLPAEGAVARFVVDSDRWVVDFPQDAWIGTAPSQAGLPVEIPAGRAHALVPLCCGAVLRGRAVDAAGRAVPGVALRASPYGGNLGAPSHLRESVTAADGTFEIDCVVPGRVGVFSASAGWAVAPADDGRTSVETGHRRGHRMEVEPGHTYDLVLELVATATVCGRVIDEAGESVPRARVGLAGDSRALSGWPPALHRLLRGPSAACDAAGRFELPGVVPGLDVELEVRDARHRPTRCEPVSVDGGERLEGLELVARRGAEVVVEVHDDAGRPIAELDVMVSIGREYRFYPRPDDVVDRTGADGRAVLRSLPRGPARVILGDVRRHGLVLPPEFDADVVVPAEGELRITVNLVRPVTIRGRILDEDGGPVAGALVVAVPRILDEHDVKRLYSIVAERVEFPPEGLRQAASLVASRRATTGPDGRFTIVVDRRRNYMIDCHEVIGKASHHRPSRGGNVVMAGGEPVTIVVGPRTAPQVWKGRSRD